MDAVSLAHPSLDAAPSLVKPRVWIGHLPWLIVALVAALVARLPFYWGTPYPLNDGGMFAQIVDNLRANHFLLPRETTYNFAHIPLCYPPLGFYFGAFWTAIFHQSTLEALRWVPLLFNLGCVLVLYLIALEFFEARWLAGCAACFYAVAPWSSDWLTMGGGLTRSPGEFFAMLAMLLFLRSAKRSSRASAAAAGVLVGLSLLTHLEAGLFAAVSLGVLAFLFVSLRKGVQHLLIAGVVSALIFVPWLLWMIVREGSGPFAAAFLTHGYNGESTVLVNPLALMPWILLAVGMAVLRQPAWAIWILVVYILIPRSAETHIAMILALFAGWALSKAYLTLSTSNGLPNTLGALKTSVQPILATAFVVLCFAFSIRFVHRHNNSADRQGQLYIDDRAALSKGDGEAMAWVRDHIPANARFFIFGERSRFWAKDMVAEWFPYLAQRQSVYTPQGREWLPNKEFAKTIKLMVPNQAGCTEHAIQKLLQNASFDYMLVSGPLDEENLACAQAVESNAGMTKVVYNADDVTILTRPLDSKMH